MVVSGGFRYQFYPLWAGRTRCPLAGETNAGVYAEETVHSTAKDPRAFWSPVRPSSQVKYVTYRKKSVGARTPFPVLSNQLHWSAQRQPSVG